MEAAERGGGILKFYVSHHAGDPQAFYVFVSFSSPQELNFDEPDKCLARFLLQEDAEAYKARKEKEYKC